MGEYVVAIGSFFFAVLSLNVRHRGIEAGFGTEMRDCVMVSGSLCWPIKASVRQIGVGTWCVDDRYTGMGPDILGEMRKDIVGNGIPCRLVEALLETGCGNDG